MSAPMSDTMTAPAALQLPPELTIYAVGELHPQWLAWLSTASRSGQDEALVHAAAVDQVDAAGLQMLASLQRSLGERGLRMRLSAASATLRDAAQALGLWAALSGEPEGAAA